MGHSRTIIERMGDQENKYREYIGNLLSDINEKAKDVDQQVKETIKQHYDSSGWNDQKDFLDGQNVDVLHIKEWSLDNVIKILGTLRGCYFWDFYSPSWS